MNDRSMRFARTAIRRSRLRSVVQPGNDSEFQQRRYVRVDVRQWRDLLDQLRSASAWFDDDHPRVPQRVQNSCPSGFALRDTFDSSERCWGALVFTFFLRYPRPLFRPQPAGVDMAARAAGLAVPRVSEPSYNTFMMARHTSRPMKSASVSGPSDGSCRAS